MSGEIILLSSGVATGGLAVIAAGTALLALHALMQARAEIAARTALEAEAKLAEWQAAQTVLQQENTALDAQFAQLTRLRSPLDTPVEQKSAGQAAPHTARGYLAPEPAVAASWARLQARLAAIPTAWRRDPEAPFARLTARAVHLQAQLAQLSTVQVAEFTRTLEATLDGYQQELAARRARLQRWQERAQHFLRALHTWQALLDDTAPIDPLYGETQTLLAQPGDFLHLTRLEDALHTLVPTLEQQHRRQSEQTVVAAQLTEALASLGYATVQPFTARGATRRAQFGIPGGERLQVAVQPDLRLAFEVAHERPEGVEGPLDAQELAFLTQQETRWCRDLPQLVARLDMAGIRYTVGFERHHAAERIPMVTVESAATWEAQQADREQHYDHPH